MPPAPLADNIVTSTRDQARAPGTRAPAAVTPGNGPRKARGPLPHRAQTAPSAPARLDKTGSAETRGDHLRRVAGLLRRVLKTGGNYRDPLFERPDLVEDDYYRFRNQPHG